MKVRDKGGYLLSYVCELVCVFVCTIVGASPTPACYVGQVSVCIQIQTAEEGQCIAKHRRTWCYVETDSEKRNYKWNYLYGLSLQSTINWTV